MKEVCSDRCRMNYKIFLISKKNPNKGSNVRARDDSEVKKSCVNHGFKI